ncbi:MAG: FAD-dependent oxidoreductase, partial [Candidatus Eremiobacteraeota bacterium]|nr:FAD-dependent oxidoreductase [Candidatus Eremiobacteraeota bacterium]
AAAFLSLFRMKSDPAYDFSILHARGEMQEIPDALAAQLSVRTDFGVVSLAHHDDGWLVTTADTQEHYQKVVLATTAGVARKLLRNGPDPHRDLLEKTRYARTINLSYRVPADSFGNTHCFYVPYCENSVIAEFTNEAIKGRSADGLALINVGLHEEAANKLWDRPDNQLFGLVAAELEKLHPGLSPEPHDLQRWPEAMPKFSCEQIDRVKKFLPHQGEEGLYLCGDYLNSPWLEGATRCGQRVARLITGPDSGPRSDLP